MYTKPTHSQLPGVGFFVTVCIGAFALVAGIAIAILDRHTGQRFSWGSLGTAIVGIAFIVLALMCERPGRFRTVAILLRNALITLIVGGIVLVGLMIWTGAILH